MSYQVLARKYRPSCFAELVGQEHVCQTLTHAIEMDRIHHAYLFTGVRGVGKTSVARIFAKSLNCERGPIVQSCGQCSSCKEISAGTHLDVIEIDGASNTSVDHIRELREQVKYVPASGKYKIYIIDEVHMLSSSAFNALLKTLEEPPAHVVFIFATTEVNKIPITILSRCQRFDLRRISRKSIASSLQQICEKEGIQVDSSVIQVLANEADGSMRDAQSLLDMAMSMGGGEIKSGDLLMMMGLSEAKVVLDLADFILHQNLDRSLQIINEHYQRGYDLKVLSSHLLTWMHDLVLLKVSGTQVLIGDRNEEEVHRAASIIETLTLDDLQIAFQICQKGVEDILRSEIPKILFDILLVKLIHGSPFQSLASAMNQIHEQAPRQNIEKKLTSEEEPHLGAKTVSQSDWMSLLKPQIKGMMEEALSADLEQGTLKLVFSSGSFGLEILKDKQKEIENTLSLGLSRPIKIEFLEKQLQEIEVKSDEPAVPQDEHVLKAMEIFNAKIEQVKG